NMLPSIEQHVDWIAASLVYMRARALDRIEPSAEAEDNWIAHASEVAQRSLRSTCSSWYVGANIPGKPRVFMPYLGGFPAYVEKCREVAANGYEGFMLSAGRPTSPWRGEVDPPKRSEGGSGGGGAAVQTSDVA